MDDWANEAVAFDLQCTPNEAETRIILHVDQFYVMKHPPFLRN